MSKKKDLVCELLNASLVFTDSLHCLAAFLLLRLHLILKLPHLKRCKNHFLQPPQILKLLTLSINIYYNFSKNTSTKRQ